MLRHVAEQVSLFLVIMPDGALARTDGHSRIWLDKRLQPSEARCALMHELIHIEHGHTSCQEPRVERAVREETARRLIPLDQLAEAVGWTQCPSEIADELAVTDDVLHDRLNSLTASENEMLARASEHH